ncbi:hypothetical protein SUGI_0793370 [Cryptomeria japonica]|nr:hypothetical protein SUGI_0793370 [Cryptomeria japonica]
MLNMACFLTKSSDFLWHSTVHTFKSKSAGEIKFAVAPAFWIKGYKRKTRIIRWLLYILIWHTFAGGNKSAIVT